MKEENNIVFTKDDHCKKQPFLKKLVNIYAARVFLEEEVFKSPYSTKRYSLKCKNFRFNSKK